MPSKKYKSEDAERPPPAIHHHVNSLRYVTPYLSETVHWPKEAHADKALAVALADIFGGPQQAAADHDAEEACGEQPRNGEAHDAISSSAAPYWAREIDAGRVMLKLKRQCKDDPEPCFQQVPASALVGRQSVIRIVRHVHERVTCATEPRVLHEDDTILAVDKPGGVPVQDDCDGASSVVALVKRLRPELSTLRPAHRLDIGTSGVLILAKGGGANKRLMRRFEERQVDKTYFARVRADPAAVVAWVEEARSMGLPSEEGGWRIVDHSQRFVSRDSRAYVVEPDEEGAKVCRTAIRPLLSGSSGGSGGSGGGSGGFADGTSLVECRLYTGRRHQIRCCLESLGWPIANDSAYGGACAIAQGADLPRIYADDESNTLSRMLEGAAMPWCDKCKWCMAAVRGEVLTPVAAQPLWLHARQITFLPDGPSVEAPLPPWATPPTATMTTTLSARSSVGLASADDSM